MSTVTQGHVKIDDRVLEGKKELGWKVYSDGIPSFLIGSHTYTTHVPISSKEFRAAIATQTYVTDNGESITLHDDTGYPTVIEADRDVLEHLLKECEEQCVPLRTVAPN